MTDGRKYSREIQYPVKFFMGLPGRPISTVNILCPAFSIDAGCLQIGGRVFGDPNIGPGGRDGKFVAPFDCFFIDN